MSADDEIRDAYLAARRGDLADKREVQFRFPVERAFQTLTLIAMDGWAAPERATARACKADKALEILVLAADGSVNEGPEEVRH
jgi:hypothetical protein